jgi:iron complex outermembrane recepter protein
MSNSRGRDLFKVNAVTAGCLVALLAGGSVQAQQALDTVVVTGIRKGIEDAINVKKNKDSIVESISAEDIGKLPDASVAESISRLPGVTAQRTAGRAQQISIRGMAPDFSTALLNGREQVTTGDSRGVEFDQFPSELLAGVTIYKTPDGALVGQGLSGTIDLLTVRPLNFGKRTIAVSARDQKTGVGLGKDAEGKGDRINVSYVDQFFDRTLGVALGWARFNEDGAKGTRFEAWGVANDTFNGVAAKTPGGFNAWQDQTTQTRTGTMGVVQFRPSKDVEFIADVFFSKFDKDKASKGFQAPVGFSSAGGYDPGGTLTAASIAGGVASTGTYDNFKGVVRNDTEYFKDELKSIGLNGRVKMGGWTFIGDLSTSNAKRTGAILETTAGLAGNAATLGTISWTGFDGNNVQTARFTTSQNYSDPNIARLTDVMGWGGGQTTPQAGYSKIPNVKDELYAGRFTAKTDLPEGLFFNSVEFGVNQTNREKDRAYIEGRLVIAGNGGPFATTAMPGGAVGEIAGVPVLLWNPAGSVGSVYTVASKIVADIANKDWNVKEKVTTAFSKFNLDTELFGMPLRGNAGLQWVNTKQSSSAFNVDGSACTNDVCPTRPNFDELSYSDVLPSLNLVLDMGGDQVVRFGLARTMARANLGDMRASIGFGVDANNGNPILKGGAGNPRLKPFMADAVDVSYEKYFGTKGYIGAAAFYKKLNTYVLKQNIVVDFRQYDNGVMPLPSRPECVSANGTRLPNPDARCFLGLLDVPLNGNGGNIKGIELTASLPLKMLWDPLDGFGIQSTYSRTTSSVSLISAGLFTDGLQGNLPLPGLSRDVGSLQVYFEKWGFQARVNRRYRSDFLGEISTFTGDRSQTFIKAEYLTDAQIGYEVQSGFAKGLSVQLQAYNLTNQAYRRYAIRADGSIDEKENTKYGKTYLLGVSYKL